MEIILDKLTKNFTAKNKKATVAVDNLSVTIPSGHLVGLLGPSGCGKSTTLYMIAGLYEPTSGNILFGKENVTKLPPEKRGIGLVFQNYALYPHMKIYDNIAFPLRNSKTFKKAHPDSSERKAVIDQIVKENAKIVHITELLQRKPAQLSGGQQQRVAIARALAKKPKVLLLDEPLSNLDARLRIKTREEIRRIQQKTGITTIFVTHDQEEAMSITDEIIVMEKGKLQQLGNPQKIYEHPGNAFVAKFLGNPPINLFNAEIVKGYIIINNQQITKTSLSDQEVQIGIRPENFIVTEHNSDKNISVNVDFKSAIGRDILINFYLNNVYSKALVTANNHIKIGDTVYLSVEKTEIHVFDMNGKRLEKW